MKTWTIVFIIIVMLIAVLLYVAFNKKNNKCSDTDTPYVCVQKIGAVPFRTSSGQEGAAFGDYQFYSNNRVLKVSTKQMGSYNKEIITWDKNAGTTTIKSVFNK